MEVSGDTLYAIQLCIYISALYPKLEIIEQTVQLCSKVDECNIEK